MIFKRIFFFCFLAICYTTEVLSASTTCEKIDKLLYITHKLHYQPKITDKLFASKAVENFLFYLDPYARYFYDSDIKRLREIQTSENDINNILCTSFDFILRIYQTRIKETDSLVSVLAAAKFSWNKLETIHINDKFKDTYPKNITEKSNSIKLWIKLHMLFQLETAEKLDKNFEFEKNNDLFVKAINKVKKNISKNIHSAEESHQNLEEIILDAIAGVYDPHTTYFTAEVNKKFTESLSVNEDVYGFYVEENESKQIVISAIKPGSPAWKSNKLNKGDVVLEVKFKNKQFDVADMDIDEFTDIMEDVNEKEMNINVRKKNGSTESAFLIKASMRSDENVINSFVLNGEKPIGYIPLPSFYTDFSNLTASGCANDVAKEIAKLKQENIEGLILDLRNNGGGSLDEAINLAGIFIDAAPLCLMKIGDQKPILMKDYNRGLIYSGSLLVLVNKASASASELLAQMLMDQHRAIIAGGSTFGKATGQVVLPLDTNVGLNAPIKKLNTEDGYIKVTVEKLYNLQGKTHQAIGVFPDIIIPDLSGKLNFGENEKSNALQNDEIAKKVTVETPIDEKIAICKEKSKLRIDTSSIFKRIKLYADTISLVYSSVKSINVTPQWYSNFLKQTHRIENFREESMVNMQEPYTVKPTNKTLEIMKMDEYLKEMINDQATDIKKDVILKEAYNILIDHTK